MSQQDGTKRCGASRGPHRFARLWAGLVRQFGDDFAGGRIDQDDAVIYLRVLMRADAAC